MLRRLAVLAIVVSLTGPAFAQQQSSAGAQQQADPVEQRIKTIIGELMVANSRLAVEVEMLRARIVALQSELAQHKKDAPR